MLVNQDFVSIISNLWKGSFPCYFSSSQRSVDFKREEARSFLSIGFQVFIEGNNLELFSCFIVSIRGLRQISETIAFVFIPVDALPCIVLERLKQGLIRIIIINFSPFYYPAKNRCRLLTIPCF